MHFNLTEIVLPSLKMLSQYKDSFICHAKVNLFQEDNLKKGFDFIMTIKLKALPNIAAYFTLFEEIYIFCPYIPCKFHIL